MTVREPTERVAITGAGLVSALGVTVESFEAALFDGRVTIELAPWSDPEHPAWWSPVPNFDAVAAMTPQVVDGTDRFAQFAIAAAVQAVEDAKLASLDSEGTAVVLGTSAGGVHSLQRAQYDFDTRGVDGISRKTMIRVWPNMAAAQISMRWKLHGPQLTVCHACASGLDAIGFAARMIAAGEVDIAIAGGSDAGAGWDESADGTQFVPALVAAQSAYGMSPATSDGRRASLPFDRDREGIVNSEGAAVVVLESESHLRKRGATAKAWVAGHASLADSFHPSSPDPSGVWEGRVMQRALGRAGMTPNDIDLLIAHGTGTPQGDGAEIRALNSVFAETRTPLKVISIKGHMGHSGAPSGAMGVVAALAAMRQGRIPHTAGTKVPDPVVEFDLVIDEPRYADCRAVQLNAFGFGGQNSSLVLERADD
jgi:3-oxoacyl-[acyl-carrier-protein] synthase II